MNPASATLRSSDLCALLAATDRSLHRWLAHPYPVHHIPTISPRGRTFALPEIVVRLRKRRSVGLDGDDLARVVAFDTATRTQRQVDDMWIGEDAQGRAASFFAALDGEEDERARACKREVRNAATSCSLTGVSRLGQIALIHPGIVRYILTDEANELPVGDAGWQSFAKALWAVNPAEHLEEAA